MRILRPEADYIGRLFVAWLHRNEVDALESQPKRVKTASTCMLFVLFDSQTQEADRQKYRNEIARANAAFLWHCSRPGMRRGLGNQNRIRTERKLCHPDSIRFDRKDVGTHL